MGIPLISNMLKEQKFKQQVKQIKTSFLRQLDYKQIKQLANSKGLPLTYTDTNHITLENTNPTKEYTFYELTEIIATQVNSREIIGWCNKNNLDCVKFEAAINSLFQNRGL